MLLQKNEIIFLVILISTSFLVLTVFFIGLIVYNIRIRKQQEIEKLQLIVATEERERKQIAENLHDDIGPLLSAIKLLLDEIDNSLHDESKKDVVHQAIQYVDSALTQTRSIVRTLLPVNLHTLGLIKSIKVYGDTIEQGGSIKRTFNFNSLETLQDSINAEAELTLYRIIHELMTNSVKHSNCTMIFLTMREMGDSIEIIYNDNGTSSSAIHEQGIGLVNIRSRVKLLHGVLHEPTHFQNGANYKMVFNKKIIF